MIKNYFFNEFVKNKESYPDRIAVEDKNGKYTYKEIWKKSIYLSKGLINYGVRKGDRVGIYMENSVEFVICTIAIMAISAVFVPISLKYPSKRIANIIDNCEFKLILTTFDVPKNVYCSNLYFQIKQVSDLKQKSEDWFLEEIKKSILIV